MAWLIGFCVFAEAARELCFKRAATDTALGKALMKPLTWLGVFFWGIELVAWTLVLEQVPLSVAYPLWPSPISPSSWEELWFSRNR